MGRQELKLANQKLWRRRRRILKSLGRKSRSSTRFFYLKTEHISDIISTQCYFGRTEGRVYVVDRQRSLCTCRDKKQVDPGHIYFVGKATRIFRRHRWWGLHALSKFLCSQYVAPDGDIIFDNPRVRKLTLANQVHTVVTIDNARIEQAPTYWKWLGKIRKTIQICLVDFPLTLGLFGLPFHRFYMPYLVENYTAEQFIGGLSLGIALMTTLLFGWWTIEPRIYGLSERLSARSTPCS